MEEIVVLFKVFFLLFKRGLNCGVYKVFCLSFRTWNKLSFISKFYIFKKRGMNCDVCLKFWSFKKWEKLVFKVFVIFRRVINCRVFFNYFFWIFKREMNCGVFLF